MTLKSKTSGIRTAGSESLWKSPVMGVIQRYGSSRSSLLHCLKAIQEASGYISHESVVFLRDKLDIPVADIYGVISFYGMLNTKTPAEYTIRVCDSILCNINESHNILEKIEKDLGIKHGESTPDKKFALEVVPCLGLCDISPAIMINDQVYGNLTEEKIEEILAAL